MLTLRKRRIFLGISVLAFLILMPILLLYTLGYRLDSHFRMGRTGGIYVSSPLSGSEIFVKNKLEKKTNIIQGGLFLQNKPVGSYPITITKEEYWPWFKDLNVREGIVTEARAVLIPKNPKGNAILKGNFSAVWASPFDRILLLEEEKAGKIYATFYSPETDTFLTPFSAETKNLLSFKNGVKKISWESGTLLLKGEKNIVQAVFNFSDQTVKASLKAINDFPVDNKTEKLSRRQKERLWQDNRANAIWIEWLGDKNAIPYYICDIKPCEATNYLISNFGFSIKNADFLPDRRDVIIAAVQNTVFALEIDERGGRLSFPIYKGKNPTFAVFSGEQKVYVLDEGILFAINLD